MYQTNFFKHFLIEGKKKIKNWIAIQTDGIFQGIFQAVFDCSFNIIGSYLQIAELNGWNENL